LEQTLQQKIEENNIDIEILKKQASPLDIYGDSGTFDEF